VRHRALALLLGVNLPSQTAWLNRILNVAQSGVLTNVLLLEMAVLLPRARSR